LHRGSREEPPQPHPWPLERPRDWLSYVNQPAPPAEMETLRRCARRGAPYGDEAWVAAMADELGLQCALRPRGRPVKEAESGPFSGKRVLTPF
jgi:hypothetical protein